MKGSVSGIFFLLLLVSFCPKAEPQNITPGVILAVKIANVKADEILNSIPKILPGVTDPATVQSLRKCAENYYFASLHLSRIVEDLKKGSYVSAPFLVETALKDGRSCQAEPLAHSNAEFDKSCSEALSIVIDAVDKNFP